MSIILRLKGKEAPKQPEHVAPNRKNQKMRTRNALIDAARDFAARGLLPTIAQVAEAALVSQATAYRYFPDQTTLMSAALSASPIDTKNKFAPNIDHKLATPKRVGDVAQKLLKLVAERETLVRMVMALHMLRSAEANVPRGTATNVRPQYRVAWLNEALKSEETSVNPAELNRLKLALNVLISAEALVMLQDLYGLSQKDAIALSEWASETLTEAVLLKGRAQKKAPKK